MKTLEEVERYLFADLAPMQASVMSGNGAGTRRTAALLHALGDPQEELRAVHIAGTAGKGSVSAFLSSVLRAHGFRVGTFMSPHVYSVLERFQLDGNPASADELGAALSVIRDEESKLSREPLGPVSMFEVTTAAAFRLFRDQKVDYAIIETGLGGRHDATNTINRRDKLAVLTSIGYDHTAVLGSTLPEIARQKAGILPNGGQAITLHYGPEIDEAIAGEAALRGCALDYADDTAESATWNRQLGLPGRHQHLNAALAVRTAQTLARRDGWRLDFATTAVALRETSLPGRFERRRRRDHPLILDGAHNPMKLASVVDTVREFLPGHKPVWVLAVKPDKDVRAILRLVAPAATAIIATQFTTAGRTTALAADTVSDAARHENISVTARAHLTDALDHAITRSEPGVPVIVTGSFHTVAAAGKLTDPE